MQKIVVGSQCNLGKAVVVQGKNVLWYDEKTKRFTAENANGLSDPVIIFGNGEVFYDHPEWFCRSFRERVKAWARRNVM